MIIAILAWCNHFFFSVQHSAIKRSSITLNKRPHRLENIRQSVWKKRTRRKIKLSTKTISLWYYLKSFWLKVLFEKETIYTEDVQGLFEGKTAEEVIENINLREKSKEKYKKDKEQNNAINTKINIVEEKNIDANSETSKKDLEKEATIDIIEPIETKELNQNPNETKVDNEEKKD